MDLEKLKKIASKSSGGGGGAPRRKTGKSGSKGAGSNVEAKVRSVARSLKAQEIHPGFDDVMLVRRDGSAVGFKGARMDAKLESNMFVVSSGVGTVVEERGAVLAQSMKNEQDNMAMAMALRQLGMGGMMKQAEERLAAMEDGGEGMNPAQLQEMLAGIGMGGVGPGGDDDGDEVPELVGNFEEVSA